MTTDPAARRRIGGLSVRTRITAAVALLSGLALAGAGLVVYALESAHIDAAVAEQVDQELAEFQQLEQGNNPNTARPFTDVGELIELFLIRNVPDDDELLLGFWDGRPQKQSESPHPDFLAYSAFRSAVIERLDTGGSERLEDTPWGEVLVTVQPVRNNQTTGALVIANFIADEHHEIDRVMQTYLIVSLLSLGLITAAAAWQAGRLLAPVRTLREAAHQISETDLSLRIPEVGNDDITALTRTVNEMLGRLERAFAGQRQFLDDAGHELRTPLTIIQGHLELLDTGRPEEVEGTRALVLDEVERMSRLVQDLIMLAKADRPDFLLPAEVDVASLTETVLDKSRGLAPRDWQLDGTAELTAFLDGQRITQALLQLAHNAVRHTQEGDTIGIGSAVDGGRRLRFWVRDSGPGVPLEEREAIFERFHRGSTAGSDEGFGLGLSIVRAIAAGHGGTATVVDSGHPGATFVLTIPIHREAAQWPAS